LSIATPSGEADTLHSNSQSLSSLPSSPNSPSAATQQLSSSLANMSFSGNGLQSSTGSQCSSKSHSPSGSIASTMTVAGKSERSHTPNSGSENGDAVKTKVGIDDVSLEGFNIQHQICGWESSVKNHFSYLKKNCQKSKRLKYLFVL
jgi:hypothetical protein